MNALNNMVYFSRYIIIVEIRSYKMSLNDVYSKKYTPNPKAEALEYIDSVLREAVHNKRKLLGNVDAGVNRWKDILHGVKNGCFGPKK